MKNIAIYGAGGCGREIACLIRIINKKKPIWNFIGFFDDGKEIGERNEYGSVIGGMKELNSWDKPLCVAFAIGSSKILSKLTSSITNPLLDFPNIISPDTIFIDESKVTFGKGNVVFMSCLISCNVIIGDFNFFNSMNTIGHDVIIGNGNVFMPSTRISGQVIIGNENVFGVASTVIQKVQIGDRTTVGANSLILRKTKNGMTYMGCPATIVHY
ncbi:MAG: serine acetyltransferase [Bacteroidales bacterium]|nr:serine acetyltransferase [Bacteroidales bacterium]